MKSQFTPEWLKEKIESDPDIECDVGPNVSLFVVRGTMRVSTSALSINDPDHIYNQIVDQGFVPEDYGWEHPLYEEFKDDTRHQLISNILELRKELEFYVRNNT